MAPFDSAAFLRDYWQKRPLLIRNFWQAWTNPLSPDELAGLACEDEVEARLIVKDRTRLAAEQGPFAEQRFGKLGKAPWTLLVQAVDHYVPAVAELLERFRFVPNWRIDDVMVSCASDDGGVGAHFDNYDVFLVQGLGRRRWQVGARCDAATPLLPHDDLRLIADFVVTDEWVLDPGDMLYVPPGFAHNGIAVGDNCMTYSIGFRAPSRSELIGSWCDEALTGLDDDDRYADPGLPTQANPGEISAEALAKLQAMVLTKLNDKTAFARWFGEFTSARKYPEIDWAPEAPLASTKALQALAGGSALLRNPASRFAYVRAEAGAVLLFVDGECFECSGERARLAQLLCAENRIVISAELGSSSEAMELVLALYNRGSIGFEPEDEPVD